MEHIAKFWDRVRMPAGNGYLMKKILRVRCSPPRGLPPLHSISDEPKLKLSLSGLPARSAIIFGAPHTAHESCVSSLLWQDF